MSVDCFLDTNVLVYAAAGRDGEEVKRNRALQLIAGQNFGTSVIRGTTLTLTLDGGTSLESSKP